jgi:hypothetical protein
MLEERGGRETPPPLLGEQVELELARIARQDMRPQHNLIC